MIQKAYQNPISYFSGNSTSQSVVDDFNNNIKEYLWGNSDLKLDLSTANTEDIFKQIYPMFRRKKLGIMMVLSLTADDTNSWVGEFTAALARYKKTAPQSEYYLFVQTNKSPTSEIRSADSLPKASSVVPNSAKAYNAAKGLSDSAKETGSTSVGKCLYVRLYPQSGAIIPPIRPFNTLLLSNNEILQVSNVVNNNILCGLQNCIAMNTLDTQWADLYTLFFNYWINKGRNRSFDLIFGDYMLHNCYLRTAPQIPQTLEPVTFFNLDIISGDRSISDIEAS